MINEFHFSAAVVPPPRAPPPLPPEAVVILFVLVYVCVCDEAGRKGISLVDTGWVVMYACVLVHVDVVVIPLPLVIIRRTRGGGRGC